MTGHYAHVLTFDRLRLEMHLGIYDNERAVKQPVEIAMRLYFPEAPAVTRDESAAFFHYGLLCDAVREIATVREFRLLEFLTMECYKFSRNYLDTHAGEGVKLWLRVTKCNPPVEGLQAGASFIYSDLPAGATTVYTPTL